MDVMLGGQKCISPAACQHHAANSFVQMQPSRMHQQFAGQVPKHHIMHSSSARLSRPSSKAGCVQTQQPAHFEQLQRSIDGEFLVDTMTDPVDEPQQPELLPTASQPLASTDDQLQYLQEHVAQWSENHRSLLHGSTSTSSSSSRGAGTSSSDSSSVWPNRRGSSPVALARRAMGGTYRPGNIWHMRRHALYAGASRSAGSVPQQWQNAPFAVQQEPQQEEAEEQQQQRQRQQQETDPQQDLEVDFELLDRLSSHGTASTSGRLHHTSSAQLPPQPQPQAQQQQQQSRIGMQQTLPSSSLQSAVANFRDDRFEQALSRWMKEAPDWFKIRAVYERYSSRFNIVHVACALSCLSDKTAAKLGHQRSLKQEAAALRSFIRQLLGTCSALIPSTDTATAAALLHSLARLHSTGKVPLGYANELLDSILLHVEPQLTSIQPRHLSQLVWALKELKHSPPESWCHSLFASTVPQLSQLKGFETALLLRGLSVIQSPEPPSAWLSAVLSNTEGQLQSMEPRHLALLLLGLGGLKVHPSRAWMTAATSALQSKFDQIGPQAISNVLWAFVKLGVLPNRSWLTQYFTTSLQLLDSLNCHELSMNIWALSKLRLEPGDQWLDVFFDATEAQMGRFNMKDLALVGFALAKLGIRPPSTWLRRYCALLLKHKGQLRRNKRLLTQVMVALDSFQVPRIDMWRREMYAAAGYNLYKFPNWRLRVKAQPGLMISHTAMSRRRQGRRNSSSSRLPQVLRSGDWGIMDAMAGSGGLLGGSMGSYEEFSLAAASAVNVASIGSSSVSVAFKRSLPDTRLVRPMRPASADAASTVAGSNGSSSRGNSSGSTESTTGSS